MIWKLLSILLVLGFSGCSDQNPIVTELHGEDQTGRLRVVDRHSILPPSMELLIVKDDQTGHEYLVGVSPWALTVCPMEAGE